MQRYTIFFIIVSAVHVSGGFSARAQKLYAHTILYNVASCWLYLKEYINDMRFHERQKYWGLLCIADLRVFVRVFLSQSRNIRR